MADPEDHCAVNVALYGAGGHRWAMTERGKGALDRTESRYRLGPSSLTWSEGALTIALEERTMPFMGRIAGEIVLKTDRVMDRSFALDAGGRHLWSPIAPSARVEVRMDSPRQSWSGHAYFDSNVGSRPIAEDFVEWDWARADTPDGPIVHYDVLRRDGSSLNLSLGLGADGELAPILPPMTAPLGKTGWRVARAARCDAGARPTVISTLEDTPFYARSIVKTQLNGAPVTLMHESLSLNRLRQRWVETLLPFRMPRRRG